MLTTTDNPFNPYTDFKSWYAYDIQMGYNTCGYLARVAYISDELPDTDQEQAIEDAIEEILELDLTGKYVRASPEEKKD